VKEDIMDRINITVWNEYYHDRDEEAVKAIYPDGLHGALAGYLRDTGKFGNIRTATLWEDQHGLTDEVLNSTDVLLWWGHMRHHLVADEIVNKVFERVQDGMGLIVLHSGHASKIFQKLMGTRSDLLKWREVGEKERLWVVDPNHPICKGISEYIELPHEEMYGEPFQIPAPDEVIFISWFEGGEVFRSGCTFKRGNGKIFYFRPGHEGYPTYKNPQVLRVLENACEWAAPVQWPQVVTGEIRTKEY